MGERAQGTRKINDYYEAPQIQRLAIVKGQLTSDKKDVDWDDVRITVNELGKNAVVGVYKPNPETGKYIMILEADKRYDIKFSGEGIEEKEDVLDVTKNMTYHNSQQTIEVGTVNITMKEPVKEEKKNSGLLVDNHGKYTVQFMTLRKKIELSHKDFNNLDKKKIFIIKCDDGKYRYVYGDFDTFKSAKKGKQEILNNSNFKDSFVRYYYQLDDLNGKEE